MQVSLVSHSADLWDLTSEIAKNAVWIRPGEEIAEADLYLWDLEPGSRIPVELSRLSRGTHLLLVHADVLSNLGKLWANEAEPARAFILLKPVQRPTLEAFIDLAKAQRSQEELNSDRDSLFQLVLQANLKLQQYDQERTSFLARSLHDLRAPVTALQGYCGLLLDGHHGALSPSQRELLGRMLNSAQRLARLASGMFELSVNGRVQRTLELEPTDIEDCLHQALHELSQYFQDKQLTISANFEPPEEVMLIEPQRIEQVLVNLLENACKFTPRYGEIVVRGYPVFWDHAAGGVGGQANAYRIDIQDSGPGIPAHMLGPIFKEYTMCSGGGDRSGGGLGLAISEHIVKAHGGKIWADSQGAGATFSFILPFDPNAKLNRLSAASDFAERAKRMAV
jgi:signal transduction histidine kinase